MNTKVLMLHGNGGASARFQLFREEVRRHQPDYDVVFPELPGFEGRHLGTLPADLWQLFLTPLQEQIANSAPETEWILYGHGIGGSLLLEWAARSWAVPGRPGWKPKGVLLHGCIGASLKERWFPKLMKPLFMRRFIQRLVSWPALRPLWERKLFLTPGAIPEALRRQFFRDYARCAAFPVFFDLIDGAWYDGVQDKTGSGDFYFLWGDRERVVASKYLVYWQRDFPNSQFDIVADWDHFPMLDTPVAFYRKVTDLITQLRSPAFY
jgi:pimeloyl-ACP methyl ester carboxylesterase